jgi:predicted TIM-barrel fold metal-dependent hydrolase
MSFDINIEVGYTAAGAIGTAEGVRAAMAQAGVDRAVVSCPESALGDFVKGNAKTLSLMAEVEPLLGWVVVNPGYAEVAAEEMRRYMSNPRFVGVTLQMGRIGLGDITDVKAVLSVFRRYGKPIRYWCQTPEQVSMLSDLMAEYASMKYIIGAADWDTWRRATAEGARRPAMHLDISGRPYRTRLQLAMDAMGPNRILFGSGAPRVKPSIVRKLVESAGLSADLKDGLMSKNTARLLPWLGLA